MEANIDFKFKNPIIKKAILKIYADVPQVQGFEKECNSFLSFLNNLPKEVQICTFSLNEYEFLSKNLPNVAHRKLIKEFNQHIYFIWVISSFKMNKLFRSILKMLNDGEFYSVMHLIRAEIEIVCSTYYYLIKILPLVKEINDAECYLCFLWPCQELEEITYSAMKATRMKPLININKDFKNAINIMTMIKSVSDNQKYKDLLKFYDILSEYTHPDYFSTAIFGVVTEVYDNNIKSFEDEKLKIIPGEMNKYYLDLPKKDYLMIQRYFGMIVGTLILCQNLFIETIEKFKKVHVESSDIHVIPLNDPKIIIFS